MQKLQIEKLDEKQEIITNSPLKKPKKTIPKAQSIPSVKIEQLEIFKPVINQRMAHLNSDQQAFCVRYDNDDWKLACGYANGDVFIFNSSSGKIESIFENETKMPTSCIRWKPLIENISNVKHIVLYANSDGTLHQFHTPSGKNLWEFEEEKNSILCLDYSMDGSTFATAGRDTIVYFNNKRVFLKIRIYDDETKSMMQELKGEMWNKSGHNNRVFSLKFLNDNENVLISGGADKNIIQWDLRSGKSVGAIFGPKILGDSIDYKSNQILACSYSINDNLQVYDFSTRKLIKQFDWAHNDKSISQNVYTAQFSKKGTKNNYIIAGSCGRNEVKLFDQDLDYRSMVTLTNTDSVYSTDFGNDTLKVAYGTALGVVYSFNFVQ